MTWHDVVIAWIAWIAFILGHALGNFQGYAGAYSDLLLWTARWHEKHPGPVPALPGGEDLVREPLFFRWLRKRRERLE